MLEAPPLETGSVSWVSKATTWNFLGDAALGGTRHIWWAATQNQAPKIALAGPSVSVLTALSSVLIPSSQGRLPRAAQPL